MTTGLFPKFFRECGASALADLARGCGIDTVSAVVREGYWVDPDRVDATLRAFTAGLGREGIAVDDAVTDFSPQRLEGDPSILDAFARCGIRTFRLGLQRGQGRPAEVLDGLRRALEDVEPLLRARGLRALLQPHPGSVLTNPTAAALLLRGLDPGAFGVLMDPGNGAIEGREDPEHAVPVLGAYLAAVGVKSLRWEGTRPRWCPLEEGCVDWPGQLRALARHGFDGRFLFMPFYHEAGPLALRTGLKRDADRFREWRASHAPAGPIHS